MFSFLFCYCDVVTYLCTLLSPFQCIRSEAPAVSARVCAVYAGFFFRSRRFGSSLPGQKEKLGYPHIHAIVKIAPNFWFVVCLVPLVVCLLPLSTRELAGPNGYDSRTRGRGSWLNIDFFCGIDMLQRRRLDRRMMF